MEKKQKLNWKQKLAVLLATWFGSGLIPPVFFKGMGGTYGSFFSIPLCLGLLVVARPGILFAAAGQDFIYAFAVIFILFLGLWAVPITEAWLGPRTDWRGKIRNHDHNQIVIDETLGMLVSCWPLVYMPLSNGFRWWHFALVFGLFRLFDITKPPGVRYFDRQDDALGVMADDGVAGIYAGLCMIIVLLFSR
jgi:Phosphatidylglycerophosphatase A and related proteins